MMVKEIIYAQETTEYVGHQHCNWQSMNTLNHIIKKIFINCSLIKCLDILSMSQGKIHYYIIVQINTFHISSSPSFIKTERVVLEVHCVNRQQDINTRQPYNFHEQ